MSNAQTSAPEPPAKPGKPPAPPTAPHEVSVQPNQPGQPAYNPIEHRHVEHPNTVFGSIVNLLKACLGTGILAMPSAFKNAGLIGGTIGIIVAGIVVTHAMNILVKTAREVCVLAQVPSMSFAETCGAAFTYGPKKLQCLANCMQRLADASLTLCYMGVLCIYVVFIASSLKDVFDHIFTSNQLSIEAYCGILLLPLILIGQIRSLKYVVPFSVVANVGILITLAIVLKFIFTNTPSPSDRTMVTPITTWPMFLSVAVFAMEGIGVVMPVENEMAEPEKFLGYKGVLNITMTIVVVLYGLLGLLGYIKYGENIKGSITLNLPQQGAVGHCTKCLMALVIFCTYTLQFYVPMEAVSRRLHMREDNSKYHEIAQIGSRTLIVSISVLVAALVPRLEIVISLVGSIFFATCGVILPPLVDLVYLWDRDLGHFRYVLWKDVLMILAGFIILVTGTMATIYSITSNKKDDMLMV